MNTILLVVDSPEKARLFCQQMANSSVGIVLHARCLVKLGGGLTMQFAAIRSLDDTRRFAGLVIHSVLYIDHPTKQAQSYLNSLIRTPAES